MRVGKVSRFKLISLKEHQIWENQFHELNTYEKGKYGNKFSQHLIISGKFVQISP